MLYKMCLILLLFIIGCGAETYAPQQINPNYYNHGFDYYAGAAVPEEDPIPFDPQPYATVPIKIYTGGVDYLPQEDWNKALAFWEFVAGQPVFELVNEEAPPIVYGQSVEVAYGGVIRALLGRPNYDDIMEQPGSGAEWKGGYGQIIVGHPDSPPIPAPYWYAIAHELGHALGFGHSLSGACIMASSAGTTTHDCDLSVVKDYLLQNLGD